MKQGIKVIGKYIPFEGTQEKGLFIAKKGYSMQEILKEISDRAVNCSDSRFLSVCSNSFTFTITEALQLGYFSQCEVKENQRIGEENRYTHIFQAR